LYTLENLTESIETRGKTGSEGGQSDHIPSLYVLDSTACSWGVSPGEARRLLAAGRFFRDNRYECAHLTAAAHHLPEWDFRNLVRPLKSSIALTQRRAAMKRVYWAEVLEGAPTVHAHLIVPMPRGRAEKLLGLMTSEKFARHDHTDGDGVMTSFLNVQVIDKPRELDDVLAYLLKTTSPQAWRAIGMSAPRRPGSHPLGEGVGGDRVRLSRDLEEVLTRSGKIDRYRRTYAIVTRPTQETIVIVPIDLLFSELPVLAIEPGPRDPYKRPLLAARYGDQPDLPLEMPPDIIDLAASLGGTHREIAEKLGLSRPQVSNILCGRFRPSRRVVARVLALA
jgi:hypothetical protein